MSGYVKTVFRFFQPKDLAKFLLEFHPRTAFEKSSIFIYLFPICCRLKFSRSIIHTWWPILDWAIGNPINRDHPSIFIESYFFRYNFIFVYLLIYRALFTIKHERSTIVEAPKRENTSFVFAFQIYFVPILIYTETSETPENFDSSFLFPQFLRFFLCLYIYRTSARISCVLSHSQYRWDRNLYRNSHSRVDKPMKKARQYIPNAILLITRKIIVIID